MMSRRHLLLCLLCCGLLVSCGTGKPRPDDATAQARVEPAALPFDIPEQTFMLAQADLEQIRVAYQHVRTLVAAAGANAPDIERPDKLVVSGLLTRRHDIETAVTRPETIPDNLLEGIASDGRVWMAVSTHGNQPLEQALRQGVPLVGDEDRPRGFFVRLYIPADEPDTLEGWIRARCDADELPCERFESMSVHAAGVLIDYRLADGGGGQSGRELEAPETAADFLNSRSPALRTFVEQRPVMGFYLRSERLAAAAAQVGLLEAREAMASASPSNRHRIRQRGQDLARNVYAAKSPEAREFADSTLLLKVSDEVGVWADWVFGRTEQGARVAAAGETATPFGSIDAEGGLLEAEVAWDVSEARAAALVPHWMRLNEYKRPRDMLGALRGGGAWMYGLALHNYPAGFGRGLAVPLQASGDEIGLFAGQVEYAEAVRLKLDAEPSDEGPWPFAPRGGFVAKLDRRADVEGWVEGLHRAAQEELPFAWSSKVVETSDAKEIQVLAGESAAVGAPKPAEDVLWAELNLERGVELAASSDGMPAMLANRLRPIFEMLGQATLRAQRSQSALHIRLVIGDKEPDALSLDTNARPIAQPNEPSECLRHARDMSRVSLQAYGDSPGFSLPEFVDKVEDRLDDAQKSCTEHASQIKRMRVRWLTLEGRMLAGRLQWDAAAEAFAQACSLGGEAQCERAELVSDGVPGVEYATVSTSVPTSAGHDARPVLLDTGTVGAWYFPPEDGAVLSTTLAGLDLSTTAGRETVVSHLPTGARTGYPVVVDAAADAYVLALLTEEVGVAQNRGMARFRRSNNAELGTVVPVHSEERDGVGRLTFFAASDEVRPHVTIDVGPRGIDVAIRRGDSYERVEPIEGCDPIGPTICRRGDDEPFWEPIVRASEAERSGLVDTYVEQMRVAKLPSILAELPPARVRTTARIGVVREVPFEIIAEVAAYAQASLPSTRGDVRIELAPK